MKRLFLFSIMTLLYGCMMIAQIPRQYVYVDENCEATLPDYSDLVVVYDNCGSYSLKQDPVPGTIISGEVTVTFTAIDAAGNTADASFPVSILDTIPPTILDTAMTIALNPEWEGYSDQEVMDMYRTWYGWTQFNLEEFNRLYADTEVFVQLGDTAFTDTLGKVYVFKNTIMIPDTITDSSWWWAIVE
jgi:hypothetical protein